jgi:hypothetical protein
VRLPPGRLAGSVFLSNWDGLPPAGLLAGAMLRNDGVTVDFASAPFTKQEIARQVQAVTDLKVANRLPIVAVGPIPDLSALEVEIDSTRLVGSITLDSIKQAVTPLVDAPVTYLSVAGRPVDRTTSNDSPPWQGGAGIFADRGYCSTGFSMLVSGGYGRLLSAAHCDPTGNAVIEDGAHQAFSPGGADVDVANGYDSLLIDPNNGTIGEVYGGPWNATPTSHPNRYDLQRWRRCERVRGRRRLRGWRRHRGALQCLRQSRGLLLRVQPWPVCVLASACVPTTET